MLHTVRNFLLFGLTVAAVVTAVMVAIPTPAPAPAPAPAPTSAPTVVPFPGGLVVNGGADCTANRKALKALIFRRTGITIAERFRG